MAKHTPGPWQVVPADKAEHQWVVGDAEGGSIASCEPMGPWMSAEEAGANTRLIAAAPDLLAALEMVRDADNDCRADGLPTIPDIARAKIDRALAKAGA